LLTYISRSHVSYPASEAARDQGVNQTSASRHGLFSHPSTAQALEQRRPPLGERVDWRAIPLSAGHRRNVSVDGQPIQDTGANPRPISINDISGAADVTGPQGVLAGRRGVSSNVRIARGSPPA
jgi:hypothetical protein